MDGVGRLYFKLSSDNGALVVYDKPEKRFVRYSTPASIASVIVALGEEDPAAELSRLYPASEAMVKDRTWCSVLQQGEEEEQSEDEYEGDEKQSTFEDMDLDEPFVAPPSPSKAKSQVGAGKKVLVVSPSGAQLWSAKVVDLASNEAGTIVGYRVSYRQWSTRFDEWVDVKRVLPRINANLDRQVELPDLVACMEEFEMAPALFSPDMIEEQFDQESVLLGEATAT